MFITIKITIYYYSLTGKDLGDWSPEKDCLLAPDVSTTSAKAIFRVK